MSKSRLLRQYAIIKQLADKVSFSFKTNPEVGKVLEKETGCFFSMHTDELAAGIADKSRIWFFAQAWDTDEIEQLKGITRFVVDNEADLDVLLGHIEKNNLQIQLLLRMRMKENTVQTGRHFVFGMRAEQVNQIIARLKDNRLIQQLGIHFHRKTQNASEWSLVEELKEALSEETLHAIDIINIGGGIPVQYKNSRPGLQPIFEQIKGLREWLKSYSISLFIEPGRFLAAPCVSLEAEIKNICDGTIILDCSVYNAAVDTFAAGVRMEILGEVDEKAGKPYTMKGSTPCSLDIFRYRVYLKDPKKGDKMIFLNAGAYNFATDFCGLKKLPTVIVD